MDKAVLGSLALVPGQAGMIGHHIQPLSGQPGCGLFGFVARKTVHDARMAAVMALDKRQQLVASIALHADPVMNVGAVDTVSDNARLRLKQASHHYLAVTLFR